MKRNIDLKANDTIVFIGDSITDAGRNEVAYRPFGFGYVHFATYHLLAKYPELNLNIVNTGISGNTIRDLEGRWKRDCLKYKPDIVSVLIGINDVWLKYNIGPDIQAEGVFVDEYEATFRKLLSGIKDKFNSQLVLMEPFMFCDDLGNELYKDLKNHIKIVHKMAEEFDAVLVPLQKFIGEQIKEVPAEKWSDDMVHPFVWAHAWIANHWLKVTNLQ